MTICSTECENCRHGEIDETNKAKVVIHCDVKGKTIIYGQMIDCDDKESK